MKVPESFVALGREARLAEQRRYLELARGLETAPDFGPTTWISVKPEHAEWQRAAAVFCALNTTAGAYFRNEDLAEVTFKRELVVDRGAEPRWEVHARNGNGGQAMVMVPAWALLSLWEAAPC